MLGIAQQAQIENMLPDISSTQVWKKKIIPEQMCSPLICSILVKLYGTSNSGKQKNRVYLIWINWPLAT